MYQHSTFELFGGLTAVTTAIVQMIRRPRYWSTYGLGLTLIILGVFIVGASCVFNSMAAHNWDRLFIVAFLQLKVVGSCLLRGSAYAGYIFIIWGISVIIIRRSRSGSGLNI
jgi:hypothetical protein